MTIISELEQFQQKLVGLDLTKIAVELQNIIESAKSESQEPIGYVSQYTRKFLIAGSIGYIYPSKLEDNDLGVFAHPPLSDETVKDAERYAWLRKNVADPESKWCVYEVSADQYPDLDGAIDKAMIGEAMRAAK